MQRLSPGADPSTFLWPCVVGGQHALALNFWVTPWEQESGKIKSSMQFNIEKCIVAGFFLILLYYYYYHY